MSQHSDDLKYRELFGDELVDLIERWSYKFAKPTRNEPEDLRQILRAKLLKCQESYQPNKMMPLDYERVVKSALYRRILDLIRAEKREKRRQESKNISLYQENQDGEEYLIETIQPPDAAQIQKNAEFQKSLANVLRTFDEEENQIFDLLMLDFSKTAIAELLGMHRATVYERIKSIKRKINRGGIGIERKEKSDS